MVFIEKLLLHNLDMGCGEIDGSYREQLYNPSLNTTTRLMRELHRTDFLMHIGDMELCAGIRRHCEYIIYHIQSLVYHKIREYFVHRDDHGFRVLGHIYLIQRWA